MTRGNLAIRDHQKNGKRLRLFQGDGDGRVTYLGEFEYVAHRIETIPGSGNSQSRKGIIFTLKEV
jgi:5-methylcytosine-specific restriction protein A